MRNTLSTIPTAAENAEQNYRQPYAPSSCTTAGAATSTSRLASLAPPLLSTLKRKRAASSALPEEIPETPWRASITETKSVEFKLRQDSRSGKLVGSFEDLSLLESRGVKDVARAKRSRKMEIQPESGQCTTPPPPSVGREPQKFQLEEVAGSLDDLSSLESYDSANGNENCDGKMDGDSELSVSPMSSKLEILIGEEISPGSEKRKRRLISPPLRAFSDDDEAEHQGEDPDTDVDSDDPGQLGIGYRPTPVQRYVREQKRRHQIDEYRKREQREMRERRSKERNKRRMALIKRRSSDEAFNSGITDTNPGSSPVFPRRVVRFEL